MQSVYVDTVAWIALLNADDALHEQVRQVMDRLRRRQVRLVTTGFVLLEVADALSSPSVRAQTVTFIEGLQALTILRIVPVSQSLLDGGWALYRIRPDKDWGLTDCTSFVVMAQERITQALTSDHHFEQAGFVNLLSPPP